MNTADFDFTLPQELIAQSPADGGRDHSRLMVLHRSTEHIEHRQFFDITDYLHAGDVLVMNDSAVMPARLIGRKSGSGGKVEFLLLRPANDGDGCRWEAMVGSRRMKEGQQVEFADGMNAVVEERASENTRFVRFKCSADELQQYIDTHGQTPIPPYIAGERMSEKDVRKKYQTVYARESGSAAAPTAGLHFTHELLEKLRANGVQTATVTLHVGLGTFAPVKTDDIADHTMHSEFAIVPQETADMVNAATREGRRVIGVGTTSVRTLESFTKNGVLEAGSAWTDIFITPGYTFQCIDGMITNFHLPKSTLIMLVSALAGREFTLRAYKEAIAQRYRFYSFGDAMLILP